eukprot:CAMPEP_0178393642 /NCGR_PEP_ID=MMETSP0689_2-20121128/12292_1 /TAXON_ID=160604 /ORGANISM="Amphidinium massartii, Strain CS-259" /LENGTH=1057 /DNA_ID=CAMNT_0020014239 /DNA_START=84 /DNA_END=3254 /DNA_ORIENTATION=+
MTNLSAPSQGAAAASTAGVKPELVKSLERVQLFVAADDPSLLLLHLYAREQMGFLYRLCELLLKHGINIVGIESQPVEGTENIMFVGCKLCKPSLAREQDAVNTALMLGKDLEHFIQSCVTHGPPVREQAKTLDRLNVNLDLVSVSSFKPLLDSIDAATSAGQLQRYELEITGLDQAGLMAYLSLIFFRCGFNILKSSILGSGTNEMGQLRFELQATSQDAVKVLRSYLDMPDNNSTPPISTEASPNGMEVSTDAHEPIHALILHGQNESSSVNGGVSEATPLEHLDTSLPNGDRYTGGCAYLPGDTSPRRHGFGTYMYNGQRAAEYTMYRGQWQDGAKAGNGVVLHRGGGIYVGQWRANMKNGVGVAYSYAPGEDKLGMPSSRYEGEWQNDTMHGFGVQEAHGKAVSRNMPGAFGSQYFGFFQNGQPNGQGVNVHFDAEMRVIGCEAMSGGQRRPLLEAMDEELNKLLREAAAEVENEDPPVGPMAQSLDDLHTVYMLAAPSEDFQRQRSDPVMLPVASLRRECSPGSSAAPAPSSGSTVAAAGGGLATYTTTWMSLPACESHLRNEDAMHAEISAVLSPCSKDVRSASPVGKVEFKMVVDGLEEEEGVTAEAEQDFERPTEAAAPPPRAPTEVEMEASAPIPLASGDLGKQLPESGPQPSASIAPGRFSRTSSPVLDGTVPRSLGPANRPILSPMLWSEDETAAFLCCLGIDIQVASRLRDQKLRGPDEILQMPDSRLAADFGLTSAAQRHVVKRALKRFLEIDRWQNAVRGRRIGDTVDDPGLQAHIIPLSKLCISDVLSQGGYGQVHKGVVQLPRARGQHKIGQLCHVAAKEMKGNRVAQLSELIKESRIMASLHHENICTFIGISAELHVRGGKQYILTELMDCSLFDLVHRADRVPKHFEVTPAHAMQLTDGIAAGVAYLHDRKLVHADLKSSNVLLDLKSRRHPVPKLCDFGHVAVRAHPAPHSRCGTPHWAAPEVLRQGVLGSEADVYSCGVMLWEMLAKQVPLYSLTFAQVVGAVGWAGWKPDYSLLPQLPPEAHQLLESCLAFEPSL